MTELLNSLMFKVNTWMNSFVTRKFLLKLYLELIFLHIFAQITSIINAQVSNRRKCIIS